MTHPTVSNEAMRAYLRERKGGLMPDPPTAADHAVASAKVWGTFLAVGKKVMIEHFVNDVTVPTLHGEKKDALEIKASLDWYAVFKDLSSEITGDLGFWRWVTAYTPQFFDFARWRDGSLDSWPKKEAAFGIMRLIGDSPECVALRMYRRGLICTRGSELGLWDDPREVAGTDLWRSGVLRRAIGYSPDAASIYVKAVVQLSVEQKVSLTDLARLSAKRVNRLRPLFQWEAMTPNEIKTLVEGQIRTAVAELSQR
jgi:hypothetical protein